MARRFYHSVRFKLLLVSLTLLGIPWAGYRFIIETEHFLRDAQNRNLQSTAQAIARVLERYPEQFDGSRLPGQHSSQRNLYLHRWTQAPVVDGYPDEWEQYTDQFSDYRLPDGSLGMRLALGEHAGFAYLLLAVSDTSHDYTKDGDRIELSTVHDGKLQRLRIQSDAPGWVIAEMAQQRRWQAEPRIRGEWQESPRGYTLELRLPLALLGDHLSVGVFDSRSGNLLASARLFPANDVGRLIGPSATLQRLLAELTPAEARTWVVDHEALVLARAGRLDAQSPLSADQEDLPWLVQQLILAVLPRHADARFVINPQRSRLDIEPLEEALAGRPANLRRQIPGSDAIAVSAAVPVRGAQGVIGAVLVEQTTNAILSIQNLALQRLFAVTLVLFVVTSLGLLLFASLLTARIRRLRDQLDQAVSHDGRIVGEVVAGRSRDEIGELGRGLSTVLTRLHDYNHYLEAMASRLAHELRTPLSVLRTSLDNAGLSDDPQERSRYLTRAQGGAERLELILKRLREATRLEQSLQHAEFETFDLRDLLHHQLVGWREIWPRHTFRLQVNETPAQVDAVPDLISQALDKLVSNASDFAAPDSVITISLQHGDGHCRLTVRNQGPALPPDMDLFKSMVSGRTGRSEEPHLGLGLYLVRLIAEFHAGQTFARNTEDDAVEVGFTLANQHP